MAIPAWAFFPAAGKLIAASLRHPNTEKAVVVEPENRSVKVLTGAAAAEVSVSSDPAPHTG
jgi:hypothetical protein